MIWALTDERRIARNALRRITDASVRVVSAATLWEISTKMRTGKLKVVDGDIESELATLGYELLSITPAHGWAGGALPLHHRDPFDRILVAQAQLEGLTIVTRDPAISRYQVAVLAA